MNYCVYFSPTGTTERMVKYAGERLGCTENIDLCRTDLPHYSMGREELCVVGVPSFGGRVPLTAAERLQRLRGDRTPALLIVTYGGRAYEDTLRELKDTLETRGFWCLGAAAMVTEHSIAREIEAGRPCAADYRELARFLTEAKDRLRGEPISVRVPGNDPYKEYKVLPMGIRTAEDCMRCGRCAGGCPAGAIPTDDPRQTDAEKCISCMRCVTLCPAHARSADPEKVRMIGQKLKAICPPDKPNEFFEIAFESKEQHRGTTV